MVSFTGIAAGMMPSFAKAFNISIASNETERIFKQMVDKARLENWETMPIGLLVVKIAESFLGTPYVANTLEGEGGEICRLNLAGLDCVTFFEDSLCLARILKKGKYEFQDYINELTYVRYRHGKIQGYASRLHYTSDWIFDNVNKGVIRDVTKSLGGEQVHFDTYFMTKNNVYYDALKGNPGLIDDIASIEDKIKTRASYVLPKDKIKKEQANLNSGDIIAITTAVPGLDYSHTGLIAIDDKFKPRFLHASSTKREVTLDVTIGEYIAGVKNDTGITVLRPLEV